MYVYHVRNVYHSVSFQKALLYGDIVIKWVLLNIVVSLSCSSSKETWGIPTSQSVEQDDSAAQEEVECMPSVDTHFMCPTGFVGIPTAEPIICMMSCEVSLTEEGVVSQQGLLPSSNISFYDAQEYCGLLEIEGSPSRLPTMQEWIDAGDGVWGEGGTDYPWGDDFHSGECVLPMNDEAWDGYQVCGYLETCVSDFGVYDQIGNLWEWVDSRMYVDIDAWFVEQENQGRRFFVYEGFLHSNSEQLIGVYPFAVGLSGSVLDVVDSEIWIRVAEPFRADLPGVGYLRSGGDIPSNLDFLPISLYWDTQRMNARIVVEQHRDHEPIPAKVGGAFYSGADARLDTIFWGHVPTFDGSIGFRCVYDVP